MNAGGCLRFTQCEGDGGKSGGNGDGNGSDGGFGKEVEGGNGQNELDSREVGVDTGLFLGSLRRQVGFFMWGFGVRNCVRIGRVR